VYLASSVVKSLREAKGLSVTCLDFVFCPVDSCITVPEACGKGFSQACEKRVDVVYEHDGHNKLVVLSFRCQLRNSPREGFIDKSDFALNVLLKRKIISVEFFVSA
jgi:hypothetical protein